MASSFKNVPTPCSHPDQAVHVIPQLHQGLVTEPGCFARGYTIVHKEDGVVLELPVLCTALQTGVPGFQELRL